MPLVIHLLDTLDPAGRRCCACGHVRPGPYYSLLLDRLAPPGAEVGWGCFSCGLPRRGAVAVVCSLCAHDARPLRWVLVRHHPPNDLAPVAALGPRYLHRPAHRLPVVKAN